MTRTKSAALRAEQDFLDARRAKSTQQSELQSIQEEDSDDAPVNELARSRKRCVIEVKYEGDGALPSFKDAPRPIPVRAGAKRKAKGSAGKGKENNDK